MTSSHSIPPFQCVANTVTTPYYCRFAAIRTRPMTTAQLVALDYQIILNTFLKTTIITHCLLKGGRRMDYRTEPKLVFFFDDDSSLHFFSDGKIHLEHGQGQSS
jgi:hypothetical protein